MWMKGGATQCRDQTATDQYMGICSIAKQHAVKAVIKPIGPAIFTDGVHHRDSGIRIAELAFKGSDQMLFSYANVVLCRSELAPGGVPTMVVNDNAYLLAKRGALESIASELAPTISLSEQHCPRWELSSGRARHCGQARTAIIPASTSQIAPVTQDVLSDSRNRMVLATSSGTPTRPRGWKSFSDFIASGIASLSMNPS